MPHIYVFAMFCSPVLSFLLCIALQIFLHPFRCNITIIQRADHWLPTTEARVQSHAAQVGFVVDEMPVFTEYSDSAVNSYSASGHILSPSYQPARYHKHCPYLMAHL
jgi:hypothetical protein